MGEPAENLIFGVFERPKTRGDCAGGPRPCPWVGCRYHLLTDLMPGIVSKSQTKRNRAVLVHSQPKRRVLLKQPDALDQIVDLLQDMPCTCLLDTAQLGDHTLEEAGEVLYLTRERIRQIERSACAKLGLEHDAWIRLLG